MGIIFERGSENMKVLLIGQLPKEIGGNYTTGAANVVYELSKQREDGVLYYISVSYTHLTLPTNSRV